MTTVKNMLADKFRGAVFELLDNTEKKSDTNLTWGNATQILVTRCRLNPDEAADIALEYIGNRAYLQSMGLRPIPKSHQLRR